jgi:hypothetical protein
MSEWSTLMYRTVTPIQRRSLPAAQHHHVCAFAISGMLSLSSKTQIGMSHGPECPQRWPPGLALLDSLPHCQTKQRTPIRTQSAVRLHANQGGKKILQAQEDEDPVWLVWLCIYVVVRSNQRVLAPTLLTKSCSHELLVLTDSAPLSDNTLTRP